MSGCVLFFAGEKLCKIYSQFTDIGICFCVMSLHTINLSGKQAAVFGLCQLAYLRFPPFPSP